MHLLVTEPVVQPLPADLACQVFSVSSFFKPGRMSVRSTRFGSHFADDAYVLAPDWHCR